MRHLFAIVIVLVCAFRIDAQTLELPAAIKVQYRPGRLIVVDAKTDAEKGVTWEVVRPLGFELEAIKELKRITLGMPAAGSSFVVVGAIACKDGRAIIAQCRVEIAKENGNGVPPPDQPPDQPPATSGNVKHCTLLVSSPATAEAVKRLLAPELTKRSVRLYVLAVANADAEFKKLFDQAGDCVVLQDAEGNVIGGEVFRLQLTTDAARDAAELIRVVDENQ